MFSRISRYRKLPDVVIVDAKGRRLASKSLRLLPDVTGTFLHTVEEGDRLDHLAFKYYEQPRSWWHIADANPAFLSPEAMLDQKPWITLQIPLTWDGPAPPWSELLRDLLQIIGVETAVMGSPEQAFASSEILLPPPSFTLNPSLTAELDESGRTQVVTPALTAALLAEGVTLSTEIRLEKPDAVTWHLTDLQTGQTYTFRHFENDGILNVYESIVRFQWSVTVKFNSITVSEAAILSQAESHGFTVGQASEVRRIGKSIVIPPRVA